MALFDALIDDVASRFGLGVNALPLVREALNLIFGSQGGVNGFLKKLKDVVASDSASWMGHSNALPLTPTQVERVIGASALGGIADRLGLGHAAASTALGYALPKLIGLLTPNGVVPSTIPAEVTSFLSAGVSQVAPSRVDVLPDPSLARGPQIGPTRVGAQHQPTTQAAPRRIDVYPSRPAVHDEPALSRWLWPLLAALAILGLGLYFWPNSRVAPSAPVAQAPVVTPAPTPAPVLAPPRLAITNDDGAIHYSGVVHDEETRNSIVNALKAVFGDKVSGDIAVDLNRAAAPWLVNFRNAIESLKTPGVQAVFDGNSVNLGGVINDADRDRITSSLKSVLGGGLVFGVLSDQVADLISSANAKATSALSALKAGFTASDLATALNQSIVNFSTGSAEVPTGMLPFLQTVAGNLKQLGHGTVIKIAGYTDSTGDPAANVTLSPQRADAVRNALIKAGVDADMLVAKGYGSANPLASNDLLEGRFRNRRIEYHVVKTAS
jgi:OOP family OmpA-OmpF porin